MPNATIYMKRIMDKRLLLLLFNLMIAYPMFAQKISERIETDNSTLIQTEYMISRPFFTSATGIALAKFTDKIEGRERYELLLYFEMPDKTTCQKGSRAIIKTRKGSIITLKQKTEKLSAEIVDVNSGFRALKPRYDITNDDLQKILVEGIEILRIETLLGLKDFSYPENVLGEYLEKEYNLIVNK